MPTAAASDYIAAELPSKVATLWSYENQFGPCHPMTLRLLIEVGVEYARQGDLATGRRLLDRAVRDLSRCLGADHPSTLAAKAELARLLC